jgi:hypothetical protein
LHVESAFGLRSVRFRLPEDLALRVRTLIKASNNPENTLPNQIDVKPNGPCVFFFYFFIVTSSMFLETKAPSNDFIFSLEGVDYPALVMFLLSMLFFSLLFCCFSESAHESANSIRSAQNTR